jgi:hypothetical protein
MMSGAPKVKGGAAGRPAFDTPENKRTHDMRGASTSQQWRVIVCTTEALWRRYGSQQEADAVTRQLLRHGIHARAELDQ